MLVALQAPPVQARPLKVGVVGPEPFAFTTPDGKVTGLAPDLWRSLAAEMGLEYRFIPKSSVEEIITALEQRALDVGVGPITVTAKRSKRVAFTQPYFSCSQGILARTQREHVFGRLQPLLTVRFAAAVGVIVLLLLGMGVLIWLCERHANSDQFPRPASSGVLNGMWLALSAMTTVGFGDRVPVTLLGRFLTAVWMLFTLILVSALTSTMTTTLTISHLTTGITSPDQLEGHNVAVVVGTTGEDWAEQCRARIYRTDTLKEAIDHVRIGRVDAVIFDEPSLRFYLDRHPEEGLSLSPAHFNLQTYGLALPMGDSLVRPLNVALLSLAENHRLDRITTFWLSADARPGAVLPIPLTGTPSASPGGTPSSPVSNGAAASPGASPTPSPTTPLPPQGTEGRSPGTP